MLLLQIGFGKIHDCPQDRRHPNNFTTPLKLLAVWHLVHCKSPILCNIDVANFFFPFFLTMCFCSLPLNSAKVKKVQPLLLPLSALCDVTRATKNLNDSSPRWVWPFQTCGKSDICFTRKLHVSVWFSFLAFFSGGCKHGAKYTALLRSADVCFFAWLITWGHCCCCCCAAVWVEEQSSEKGG